MTEQAVRDIFKGKIKGDYIELYPFCTVEIDTFALIFSDAPDSPTYDELVAIDGGDLGYIPFFDQCKAEGILT